jgi:hypothetical protein
MSEKWGRAHMLCLQIYDRKGAKSGRGSHLTVMPHPPRHCLRNAIGAISCFYQSAPISNLYPPPQKADETLPVQLVQRHGHARTANTEHERDTQRKYRTALHPPAWRSRSATKSLRPFKREG